jgi:hypothetical protein
MPENDYGNVGTKGTIIGTRNCKGALVETPSWENLLRVWSWIPSRRFKGFEVWFYNSGIEIIPVFIHVEGKLAKSAHKV